MKNNRIEAITYDESGEGEFVVCVLDPSINGEEYVKSLNDDIDDYNEDVKTFEKRLKEFRELYRCNISFEEVTGAVLLNSREPKYPSQIPKGVKNPQTAFPEIALERERRGRINEENNLVYHKFIEEAKANVERDIKPFKEALIAKWPKFKNWASSDWSRTIYNTFNLTTFKYLK